MSTVDAAMSDAWRVRIRDAYGQVRGAGVLPDGRRVLTCAHLVAGALEAEVDGARPQGAVTLDFPATGIPDPRRAAVADGGWFPTMANGRGDVAVLAVDGDPVEGVELPILRRCDVAEGQAVRVYGHPRGMDDGVWAQARIVGSGGPGAEWIQMDGLYVTGRRIESGFSGAGVVDETGAVIGIVVAEDTLVTAKVGWMVPLEVVAAYWPPLEGMLSDRPEGAMEGPLGPPKTRLMTSWKSRTLVS